MSNTKQPTHVKIKKCSDGTYWYRNEIGKTFQINYMVNGMYRVWVNNSQSFCVKTEDVEFIYETDNTKQPPQELVEKIGKVRQEIGFGDSFQVSDVIGNSAIKEIAQIAVDYSKEIQEKLNTLETNSAKLLHNNWELREENRELREFLSEFIEMCEGGMPHDRDLKLKAKQLLNKNEDGKE